MEDKENHVDIRPFNILSVCSGGGGLDLGVHLAVRNARTVCYVEIEAYACEVLASRMEERTISEAPIWSNLKTFDGKPWRGKVDCIVGGYPCQPWSYAGKRKGTDDPRHLWPYIANIIRDIQPGYCFFENVAGHLSLGFEAVSSELRTMGYEVEAGLFSAAEIGASHIRKRLFVLAAKNNCVRTMANACCERRQQVARSTHENEGQYEGRSSKETDKPECLDKNVIGEVANSNDGQCIGSNEEIRTGRNATCDYFGFLADTESVRERERLGKQEKIASGGESRTEGFGEALADSDGIRSLDDEQSENGRKTKSTSECSGGILPNVVNSESFSERESNDETCSVSWRDAREDLGGGCDDVGYPESLRGNEIERSEQDGILQEVAMYGGLALEYGAIPLFPPGPSGLDEWFHVLNVEKTLEPAICDVVDELAVGMVPGFHKYRIDQLRLLGNGVVPACAAYGFGVLFIEHVKHYQEIQAQA